MSESFEIHDLDRITINTVGEPGNRLFLLQAEAGSLLATIKFEKQQAIALGEYLGTMIKDLPRPGHMPDDHHLAEPFDVAWAAGSIAATYEETTDRIILYIEEAVAIEADEFILDDENLAEAAAAMAAEEAATARFSLTREQASSWAIQAVAVASSGRPNCPLCNNPLGADHACPRTNGNRPPAL